MRKLIIASQVVKPTDIAPVLGETRWFTHVDDISARLDFEVPYTDGIYIPKAPVDIPSLAVWSGLTGELFRGIVTGAVHNGRESISYTARDHGFYLSQSDGIYKFAGVRADDAIRRICTDFGVPVGSIMAMATSIKQKYFGEKLSDIIKDILDKHKKATGVKAIVTVRKGLLYIEPPADKVIGGLVQLSDNTAWVDWSGTIGSNISRSLSMDEMKTIIKVLVDETVKAEARDAELIKQFGKLQEVIRIDSADGGQAAKIAQEALKEKGRLPENITLTALGVDTFVAGTLIQLTEPYTGASGKYRINAAEHTYTAAAHTMRLELELRP